MGPVRLTIVANEIQAEQLRSLLRFEGIDSMQRLTDNAFGDETSMAGEREILVKPEDLEAARSLIKSG